MGDPLLVAENVVKRYGDVTALDDVSLTVEAGECVALVGESGSGKTTLMRCFNRMVQPDSGLIQVRGENVAGLDPIQLRRSTGYVQQEGGLLPHWTVVRNAGMVPWLQGRDDAEARASAALDMVGLPPEEFGSRWPSELSGGQQQRVAIARALAGHPEVILLDEPFGALDAITRADLHEQFVALREDVAVTTLLVTHDLREALKLADRIAVMVGGRIDQVAAPAELMAQPATDYVRQLIDRAGVS